MNATKRRVCVIGCGVIGLSTAIAVQQLDLNVHVTIVADRFSPNTTSDGAAGLWEPRLETKSPQDDKLNDWILRTGRYLDSLVRRKESVAAGVQILSGYYLSNHQDQVGDWSQKCNGCRKLGVEEIAALTPNYINGWLVTLFQVECRIYLPWLMKKFQDSGGNFNKKHVNSISEISGEYDVIINCTGLRAKQFVNDHSIYPIRGQVLRVKAPWLKHFIIDLDDYVEVDCYPHIIPCRDTVVIGGTFDINNWNLKIDASITKKIWQDCSKMLPSIVNAEVDHEWVGLRPGRPTVRLERESMKIGDKTIQVVHNYGHGGRGVTMHWGCAEDAARLVQDAINDNQLTVVSKL